MAVKKLALWGATWLLQLACIPGWAQTYTVIYSFTGGPDGATPNGELVFGPDGNLYGTTLGVHPYPFGETTGTTAGSIFKISATGEFAVVHDFGAGGANGSSPSGELVRDSAGNFYGATSSGGASLNPNCFGGGGPLPLNGCGEIFKIDADGKFSVLYSFSGNKNCWQGCEPLAPLTLDANDNIYGVTRLGGSATCNRVNTLNSRCGVVFVWTRRASSRSCIGLGLRAWTAIFRIRDSCSAATISMRLPLEVE